MTEQQIKITRKLEILTRFFIKRRKYKNCPKALVDYHLIFGNSLKELLDGIDDKPKPEDCKKMAEMIDTALGVSAEITLRSRKEHRKCLDRFKSRLWDLLEVLDKYCQLFYNSSIWNENQC